MDNEARIDSSNPTPPPTGPPPYPHFPRSPTTILRQILRRIALIRTHHHPIPKLGITICRINNHPPICDRERREAIVRSELAAPGTTDSVAVALDVAVAGAAAGCGVGAGCCGGSVWGDGVGVGA